MIVSIQCSWFSITICLSILFTMFMIITSIGVINALGCLLFLMWQFISQLYGILINNTFSSVMVLYKALKITMEALLKSLSVEYFIVFLGAIAKCCWISLNWGQRIGKDKPLTIAITDTETHCGIGYLDISHSKNLNITDWCLVTVCAFNWPQFWINCWRW